MRLHTTPAMLALACCVALAAGCGDSEPAGAGLPIPDEIGSSSPGDHSQPGSHPGTAAGSATDAPEPTDTPQPTDATEDTRSR
ncbi:MAG: hypothetical protein EA398_12215 [Deltaproteobacteria bacterium]|nr:MAG: hypothetical protein EA398_12215 [Deltaproteobacteria bacterium]